MGVYLTLTRRELSAFFLSLYGYVTIAAVVFLMGYSFVTLLDQLKGGAMTEPVTQLYYSTPYFWFLVLLAGPVITMRLFSLEKASGTFETLMTAPVGDLQVVLAKFTAALVFYMLMWLPSLGYILVLRHFVTNVEVWDPGLVGGTFLGIFLLGCLFISLGCFASAMTRNQITAAMVSFTLGFSLWLLSFIVMTGRLEIPVDWLAVLVSQFSLIDDMGDFARGVIDTRHIVFYATLTVLFLFFTLRVVESRRWK